MDYNELSKDELLAICSEKDILHSSGWEKDKLIDEIIQFETTEREKIEAKRRALEDPSKQENSETITMPGTLGKVGGIISIVVSSFAILGLAFVCIIFFWFIFTWIIFGGLLGLYIWNLVTSVKYINGKKGKVYAGVLALIFGGLISGIFILVDEPK